MMVNEYKEFTEKIVSAYNESKLPAFVKEYVIRDLLTAAQAAKKQELERESNNADA